VTTSPRLISLLARADAAIVTMTPDSDAEESFARICERHRGSVSLSTPLATCSH
jgi:hypothetical protein